VFIFTIYILLLSVVIEPESHHAQLKKRNR